jgi:hypothetical protein
MTGAVLPRLRPFGAGLGARWRSLFALLLVLNLTAAPLARMAHADTFDDIATLVDDINGASGGALPFTGAQMRAYKDMIVSCSASSGSDDVVACIETLAASDAGQSAGIPSWFPQMLNVYFDLEHKDYWGLLEDTSLAVACAAAQFLAFGVDVCGAIEELVNAAKDVLSAAEAIGQFFADIGSDIANAASDVYCWFAGCDDSPPPPPPDVVAYQSFYFPRIGGGLQKRLQSRPAWVAYAGDPSTTQQGSIVDEGVAAGFSYAGLLKALPAYRQAVYSQWDSAILTQIAPAAKQAATNFDTYANAQVYAQQGMGAWTDDLTVAIDASGAIPLPLMAPGVNACRAAVAAAGGPQVDAWVSEGGASHPGVPPGFKWASSYTMLCVPFEQQLAAALHPFVASKAAIALQSVCENKGGNPNVYACTSYAMQQCHNILGFTGLPNAVCQNISPNPGTSTGTYICQPGNVVKTFVLTAPHPANCHLASVKDDPGKNGGGLPDNR